MQASHTMHAIAAMSARLFLQDDVACQHSIAAVDRTWAAKTSLGVGSPLIYSEIGALGSLGFMSRSAKRREQVWEISMCHPGLPLPRGQSFAPITIGFAGLVLCDMSPTVSCQWASVSSFGAVQTWFHTLPIEQGRFARPALPRHLHRCTVCDTQAVGDELHYVFDCPHFSNIRAPFPGLFQDAAGCMRKFMWHRDQKYVCHCLIALLQKAQT